MSIVTLKIVFVIKQKQTREHPTQGQGATFMYNRNGRHIISHRWNVLIWKWNGFDFEWTMRPTLSVNFDGQFIRSDYPFEIAFVQPPPPPTNSSPGLFHQKIGGPTHFLREKPWGRGCSPQKKSKGCLCGRGDCTKDSLRQIIYFQL